MEVCHDIWAHSSDRRSCRRTLLATMVLSIVARGGVCI